ncbi:MAG: hypothetical protein JOZ46_03510 [Candidatus Dormibacteraeota bacterium]|nr:hypothetical protein [Candidatus Dormibacteraeota bacterium]MBV9524869.1 hypothetical protein [Candidatus Dormibacteraeota bacterium]
MAIVRLANGADVSIKLSTEEVQTALARTADSGGFVELPGEDGPVLVRPQAVIAIIEDTKRGSAGFRIGTLTG